MRELDLSVIIPTHNEADNLAELLPQVIGLCRRLGIQCEVIVPDANSTDGTASVAKGLGARCFVQSRPGYGSALREAFGLAQGRYVLTLDADLSHNPNVIRTLWKNRERADILVASRYVRFGHSRAPILRRLPSVILNRLFSILLALPVRDLSSGFRLYRREVLQALPLTMEDFSVLQEIAVAAYVRGFSIWEAPFHYFPRKHGASKARFVPFGISYAKLLKNSWARRNSIEAADYDERAFYSRIIFQRMWQRRRYRIVTEMLEPREVVLDLGCGSSKILEAVPNGIGVDLRFEKLRYRRLLGIGLVQGDLCRLPFQDGVADEIICSEVIEHIPKQGKPLSEVRRVLKPGGILIIGTPDYGRITWRITERIYGILMPRGYADEHISKYTRRQLCSDLERLGFEILDARYVYQSEIIVKARLGGRDGTLIPRPRGPSGARELGPTVSAELGPWIDLGPAGRAVADRVRLRFAATGTELLAAGLGAALGAGRVDLLGFGGHADILLEE